MIQTYLSKRAIEVDLRYQTLQQEVAIENYLQQLYSVQNAKEGDNSYYTVGTNADDFTKWLYSAFYNSPETSDECWKTSINYVDCNYEYAFEERNSQYGGHLEFLDRILLREPRVIHDAEEYLKKKITNCKKTIRSLRKQLLRIYIVDTRRVFRKVINFLFKNMDDTSGCEEEMLYGLQVPTNIFHNYILELCQRKKYYYLLMN